MTKREGKVRKSDRKELLSIHNNKKKKKISPLLNFAKHSAPMLCLKYQKSSSSK